MSEALLCKACKSELNSHAKRCAHCGSFQGARSYLNALNDFVSPVITSITLIGLCFTYIYTAFSNDLKVKASLNSPSSLSVHLKNESNQVALIDGIYFFIPAELDQEKDGHHSLYAEVDLSEIDRKHLNPKSNTTLTVTPSERFFCSMLGTMNYDLDYLKALSDGLTFRDKCEMNIYTKNTSETKTLNIPLNMECSALFNTSNDALETVMNIGQTKIENWCESFSR